MIAHKVCYPRPDMGIVSRVWLVEGGPYEWTEEYLALWWEAGTILLFYAFLFPIAFFGLLISQHAALVEQRDTPITRALDFMHRHYRPQFWYFEIVHISRKLFLVGYAVFIAEPGSLMQLIWALNVAISVIAIEVQVRPFRRIIDSYCSLVSSLATIFTLLMCMVLRTSSLVEDLRESDVQESLWAFLDFEVDQASSPRSRNRSASPPPPLDRPLSSP